MVKRDIIQTLLLSFVFFIALASSVNAQVKGTDVVLQIFPSSPGPNVAVTATLSSYVTDINKALIVWSIDGEKLSEGIGKKSFSFNTGELSSELYLTANIDTIDGQSFTKSLTIAPGSIDMLWEATDSYTPPFYRGKALVASEGMFKVVTIPSVSGGEKASNLSYTWKHNGKASQASSGWGKNFMVFKNSYLEKTDKVSVVVSDIFGNKKGEGETTLYTTKPKIVFYKKEKSGVGLGKPIKDYYSLNKEGETLVAIPYFFSPKNLDSKDLKFEWSLGGEAINTENPRNEIGVAGEAGKSGTGIIKLHLLNTKTLFQEITKEIRVNF